MPQAFCLLNRHWSKIGTILSFLKKKGLFSRDPLGGLKNLLQASIHKLLMLNRYAYIKNLSLKGISLISTISKRNPKGMPFGASLIERSVASCLLLLFSLETYMFNISHLLRLKITKGA